MKKSLYSPNLLLKAGKILYFILLCSTLGLAQTPSKMIEGSTKLPENLPEAEKTVYDKISSAKYVLQSSLVEFRGLATSVQGGNIAVNLPITSCGDAIFKTIFAEYETQNEYRWEGELIPQDTCQCSDGYLVLVAHEGHKFGHLALDGDFYEIQEISDSTHTFSKISFEDFEGVECGILPSTGFNKQSADDRDEEHCEVRVLVLYNQSTVEAEGSINAVLNRIYLAMAQTNIALNNSAVSDNELHLVLAGIDSIPGYQQTSILASNEIFILSTDAFVTSRRDAVGADIVAFLSGDDYMSLNGSGDTIDVFGSSGSLTLNDTLAYVIVETGAATTSRYTFAHEIAHIFGCRHNFMSDNTPGIMHAYKFKAVCRDQHTIMHVVSKNTPRILHYSNPEVKYAGKSTGTIDQEYNAQQLRSTACQVASFRESNNNSLSIHIGGIKIGCPCDIVILFAELSGGTPGNYSFEWTVSMDGGVTYGSVLETSSQFQTDLPCPNEGAFRVRLKVTAPNGQVFFTFATIRATVNPPNGEPCGHGGNRPSNRAKLSPTSTLTASPNPASGWVKVAFPSYLGGEMDIVIVSPTGKTMFSRKINSSNEELGGIEVSTETWKNGLYFCTVSGNGFSETIKFVIIK